MNFNLAHKCKHKETVNQWQLTLTKNGRNCIFFKTLLPFWFVHFYVTFYDMHFYAVFSLRLVTEYAELKEQCSVEKNNLQF